MSRKPFYEVTSKDTATDARVGVLHTAHGDVETPVFMPVATYGAVRSLSPGEVEELGAEMILGNAYHLYQRPGLDVIDSAGGLHAFMGWQKSILTDSGGYQIFSLSKMLKLSDEGIEFRSQHDGARHFLSPEDVIGIEERLGADIIMALDVCPPYPAEKSRVKRAVETTISWSARAKACHRRDDQALFGIVQGGVHPELRRQSAEMTVDLDFSGYAIGGFSVGEPHDLMLSVLAESIGILPIDKPRYLMGIGDPDNIIKGISLGVDMFDCAYPTRVARNALALTHDGKLNLRNAQFKNDMLPLDPICPCPTCKVYSRAFLRHLFSLGDILAHRLVSYHNLFFTVDLVKRAGVAIRDGSFQEWLAHEGHARL